MTKKTVLFFVFFLLCARLTFGYGWLGHNIVAEIAKARVSDAVKDSVQKYIGDMTWESASTWMDEIKGNSKYDYMKPWHYVNIEKGMSYDSTFGGGNNVAQQLIIAIRNLRHKSTLTSEQISFNLKVVFHLIGDLHQPLHVGYGIDRGGNNVEVIFNEKKENLHRIWDTDIIEYKNINLVKVQELLANTPPASIAKMGEGSVIDWMTATRSSLVDVYAYTSPVTEAYINKGAIIIETQLMTGGVQLANILNEVFGK
ncbi:MAG: S1/P1 nuclease [Bacteroidota bacterium]